MLLRATGEASPGNTVSFLGRRITNKGDHFDISLDDEYVDNIFHEMKLNKCNPPTTAGSTTGKAIIEDEQLLDQQEHQQWSINNFDDLSENYNGWHTPGQTSATQRKNLQEFQQPTIKDQKKVWHLVRYPAGTKDYKFSIRPTIKLYDKTPQQPDLNIYVDSDWAGCHQTRRSTTGSVTELLGTCIHLGSETQGVVALSSAEAEFYAISTGAQEALYVRNFIMEALHTKRVNVRIHTDSSAGKSMATRQGVSKRARNIVLKFIFIQDLTHGGVVSLHKIPTKDNPADILTKYVTAEVLRWLIYSTGINTRWNKATAGITSTTSMYVTSIRPAYRHQAVWLAMVKQTAAAILNFLTHLVILNKHKRTTSWSITSCSHIVYMYYIYGYLYEPYRHLYPHRFLRGLAGLDISLIFVWRHFSEKDIWKDVGHQFEETRSISFVISCHFVNISVSVAIVAVSSSDRI